MNLIPSSGIGNLLIILAFLVAIVGVSQAVEGQAGKQQYSTKIGHEIKH